MMIDNDISLSNVIMKDLSDIIDEVSSLLLSDLRESIQENVYDAGIPQRYERQKLDGGLQGSFNDQLQSKIKGNVVENKISQDPSLMTHDPNNFIHGSNFWEQSDDVRDILKGEIHH